MLSIIFAQLYKWGRGGGGGGGANCIFYKNHSPSIPPTPPPSPLQLSSEDYIRFTSLQMVTGLHTSAFLYNVIKFRTFAWARNIFIMTRLKESGTKVLEELSGKLKYLWPWMKGGTFEDFLGAFKESSGF